MRKEAGFEVTDHIEICAEGNDRIEKVMRDNADVIKRDVLADDISFDSAKGYSKDWNINGEKVRLYVNRK
jgi:isoleucyl-tRNA synthetase